MSERCLVTGGAGFIGSNLVHELLERGFDVRALDDLSTGRHENLVRVEGEVEVLVGDLRDPEVVARAVRGVTRVFHQAAIPSVARSVEDPVRTHEVNATGTLTVLCACRDAGVERVVYASSSSVYGNAESLPVRESTLTRPISPYGVSKLAGEGYVGAFAATYGLRAVSLRYFNVFGPRQDPASDYAAVVPRFVTAALEGRAPVIYGDGEQSRDFTFVSDVVAANLLASEAPDEASGRTFNIAYDDAHSVNELLATIQRIVPGEHLPAEHLAPRPGDIRDSRADITHAKSVLGYQPTYSFEEGLRRTVDWFASR